MGSSPGCPWAPGVGVLAESHPHSLQDDQEDEQEDATATQERDRAPGAGLGDHLTPTLALGQEVDLYLGPAALLLVLLTPLHAPPLMTRPMQVRYVPKRTPGSTLGGRGSGSTG